MADSNTTAAVNRAKENIQKGRVRLEKIKVDAQRTAPELEAAAKDFEDTLDSVLELADRIARGSDAWAVAKRFIRRISSREFIIAVVAIIAIWSGQLEPQEAIAVAVAGGGLALGRGVAKSRVGGTDG